MYIIFQLEAAIQKASARNSGFTLIELMIVVGIIGILVSIAAPQYEKYQRKAKQSEAKIALGSIYSLEKSFYSEYSAYVPDLNAIGFSVVGARPIYSPGFCTPNTAAYNGTISGYAGGFSATSVNRTANLTYALSCNTANLIAVLQANGVPADCTVTTLGNDPQVFTALAWTQLGPGMSTCDGWTISHTKVLRNVSDGI